MGLENLTQALLARTYYYDDVERLIRVFFADGKGVKYVYEAADNIADQERISILTAPSNFRVVRDSFTIAELG